MWDDRQSRRMPTEAELLVYYDGRPTASGRVRNVCLDGLYVATAAHDLNRDDYVELEYRSRSGTRTYRFEALVVRADEQGVGLFVERDDRRAADGIRALMGTPRRIEH